MSKNNDYKSWFDQARFGMFIHWGLYAIPARGGSWIMFRENVSPKEYAKLADEFNPTHFDANEWVSWAKGAGMKYMVLTTRHHDGFCLWDSKVSDFTSVKTGAKRDFVAEYVRACRKANIKVGFYYSLLDWKWPAYFSGPKKDPEGWSHFIDYVHAQVRELCTQYGKIDILWYDGAWPYDHKSWRSKELNTMVRNLQPEILINDRSQLPEDFDTPEQRLVSTNRRWETCMTMNETWGYTPGGYKSTLHLIHNLIHCASNGGNLLLNVGPKPDGTFPDEAKKRLEEIGKWMDINGEAIYGSKAVPFRTLRTRYPLSRKGNIMYLFWPWEVHWPSWGNEYWFDGFKESIESARILATGQEIEVLQEGDELCLKNLPGEFPGKHVAVIALKVIS